MALFLYFVSIVWVVVGVLVIMGAWNESETDYEKITGIVAKPLALSYDIYNEFSEEEVVMAKIYLEGDAKAYRLGGKLYRMHQTGMESIQVGDRLELWIKKTTIVGGFPITPQTKDAPISGISRANGEVIISLEQGLAQAKQRLLIGLGLLAMGLVLGGWTYTKVQ